MKRFLTVSWLLVNAVVVTVSALEPAPPVQWAHRLGGSSSDISYGVVADTEGNVYVTGTFSGTNSLGNTNLISSGFTDVFLAKYDSAGNLLWARKAGGSSYDEGRGIALDGNNGVYVTGLFQDTASFDTVILDSTGQSDVFLAKYDLAGHLVWARRAGGNDFDEGHALAVDSLGNVYLTGTFDGNASFGALSLMNNSQSSDIFVAKTDPQGNFLWVRKAGGGAEDDARPIAVGPAATVYLAGFFAGNASFGSASLTSQGGTLRDMFLAQYSTDGTLLWVRQGGGTGEDEANGVATDNQGNALVTGSFFGAAAFGTNNLSGNGTDIFVAKYDSTGVTRWARKAGGSDSIYGDVGRGIASDASGNVYLTGYFSGTANFGPTNLTSSGFNEIFAAKYDPSGTLMWVRKAGGQNIDIGYSLALSGTNRVVVGGFFYGSATFDNAGLSSSGFDDAFLMQLASLPPPRLNIQSDGNAVTLSWPDSAAGFILESSENPSSPTNWVTVPSVTNAVTLPVSSPSKFFRLRRL